MSESCDAPKDAGGIAGGWATVDLPELGAQMYWGLDGVGALLFSQVNLQKYCPYYIARTFHVITAGSVQIGAVLSCGRIHQSVFFLSLSLSVFLVAASPGATSGMAARACHPHRPRRRHKKRRRGVPPGGAKEELQVG